MKQKITTALAILFGFSATAQDARITQYESVPLLISPANTGNYEGDLRASSSFSRLSANSLNNNITSVGIEYKVDGSKTTAIGFNYSRSGSNDFSMSGDYFGLSASTLMYLDKSKTSSFRLGIQVSHLSGAYQVARASYNHYLDVNSFFYGNPSTPPTQDIVRNNYVNFALGLGYNYTNDNIKFESNIGAYNLLNPNSSLIKGNESPKRIRLNINNSFSYKFNNLNAIKFSQMSWQEGLYINQKPSTVGLDSLRINETVYGINWERRGKTPYSVGLYSRSFKSASLLLGVKFAKNFDARISYELPLNKSSYNVSQLGISLVVIK
jgi:hypothetical protein